MKKLILVAALAASAMSSALWAADAVRVGYVDLRRVVVESKSGKQHKAELDKLVKAKQGEIEKEEQKLKAMQQEFEKERLTLTESQRQTRQKDFQEKVQAYQKLGAEAQNQLAQRDNEYTQEALGVIRGIIADVAKAEKIGLVLEKRDNSVLYAEDGLDLTDKVLQKYDARSGK